MPGAVELARAVLIDSGTSFSVTSAPNTNIAAGEDAGVATLRFVPQAQGPFTGGVDLMIQSASAPFPLHVELTGTGVAPAADGGGVTRETTLPFAVAPTAWK